MKRYFLSLIAMALIAITIVAAEPQFTQMPPHADDLLRSQLALDLAGRRAPLKVLPPRGMLMGDNAMSWTDGIHIYNTLRTDVKDEVEMYTFDPFNPRASETQVALMRLRQGKLTLVNDASCRVSVEVLGRDTLLVMRDAAGAPVKAYYHISHEDIHSGTAHRFVPTLLMGYYSFADRHALFGPPMEHYPQCDDTDPGVFNYYVNPDDNSILISYGDGRINQGDPNSPTYHEKMPGAGGAGAVMGPMVWCVRLTADGLDAGIVHDEPYVFHMPALDEGINKLTKQQSPYAGLDGKWAFASVMPLTHELLALFPTEVLTLMRAEIYARHGDTFSDPATQRYFDAQPWYHRTAGKVKLTALERFNYNLIKSVETSRN